MLPASDMRGFHPFPQERYLAGLREAAYAEAVTKVLGQGGGRELIPLSSVANADQRRRQITRMEVRAEAARPWRVTLGYPEVLTPSGAPVPQQVSGSANVSLPAGFPPTWSDVNMSRVSATCEITWGVGGAKFTALVDWRAGASFVVRGSHVTVSATLPPAAAIPALPTSAGQVAFAAMIAPDEGSPDNWLPTLTFDTGVIAALGNAQMAIPPFTRAVLLRRYVGASTDSMTLVAMTDFAATTFTGVLDYVNGPNRVTGDIMVPWSPGANARWLRIINNAAAANAAWQVEYQLNLG